MTNQTAMVQHIAQHGISKDDVVCALAGATFEDESNASGLPLIFGPAQDGREIVVIYEAIDDTHVYPVTADFREAAT